MKKRVMSDELKAIGYGSWDVFLAYSLSPIAFTIYDNLKE
jgi:hypothetical protein